MEVNYLVKCVIKDEEVNEHDIEIEKAIKIVRHTVGPDTEDPFYSGPGMPPQHHILYVCEEHLQEAIDEGYVLFE